MRRRCAHWGGVAAAGTVVFATPVLAQTAAVLPTGGARQFTIATQVLTAYNSNVTGTNQTGTAARGLTASDVYVEPSVTIAAVQPVNRELVFLTGLIGYDFYDRNTQLNNEHVDLTGGVSAQLARCQPRLTGSYARSQTRLEQLLPNPGLSGVSPQNASIAASVGLALSCPDIEGVSPTLSVSHSTYGNTNSFYKLSNSNSTSAQGGLSYARPGLGAIQTYGSFSSVAYDNPFPVPFPPFELKNGYSVYAGGVRVDRPIGTRLSGMVSVAYSAVRPTFSFNPGFSGATYSAELGYQASTRLRLHASASRAPLPSTQVGVAYSIDSRWQVDANYSLGRRLSFSVGGSQNDTSYQGDLSGKLANLPLLTSGRSDRVFGSVNLVVNRRVSAVLSANREWRDSTPAIFNYTVNLVSLTLRSVF